MYKILQKLPKAALWVVSSYINPLSLVPLLLTQLGFPSSMSSILYLLSALRLLQSSSLSSNVGKLGTKDSNSAINAEDLCGLIGLDCSVFMALAALGFEINADSIADLVGTLEEMVAGASSDVAGEVEQTGGLKKEKTYSYAVKKGVEAAEMAVAAGNYGLKAVDFTKKGMEASVEQVVNYLI